MNFLFFLDINSGYRDALFENYPNQNREGLIKNRSVNRSFVYIKAIKKTLKKRKEIDSYISITTCIKKNRTTPKFYQKRASLYSTIKGSITVEAAIVIPIFFFALICVVYLMEIMAVQASVRMGMSEAMGVITTELGETSYISVGEMESYIIEGIGEAQLDNSIIVGGSGGLDCSASYISYLTGLVKLEVSYSVEVPIGSFNFPGLQFQDSIQGKGWTGYVSGIYTGNSTTVVYITDWASVYHVDYNCSYLQLSISNLPFSQLSTATNVYGEPYTYCSFCISGEENEAYSGNETMYITNTGSHYHSSLDCSGLTRTIYAVSISDVIGKGVCSRCGI